MSGQNIQKRVNFILNNSSLTHEDKRELISRLERQQRISLMNTAKQLGSLLALIFTFAALFAFATPSSNF